MSEEEAREGVAGEADAASAPVDLFSLRLQTEGMSDDDIVSMGYSLYMEHCARPAARGEILTHDGHPVRFQPARFNHAFYTSETRKDRGRAKEVVAVPRIERIRWIVPVIAGLVPHTECFRCRRHGERNAPEQRLYVVGPEQYVVWLWTDKPKGFTFSSAYRASTPEIKDYIYRQTRIWPRDMR